jgi:hypothetical protein
MHVIHVQVCLRRKWFVRRTIVQVLLETWCFFESVTRNYICEMLFCRVAFCETLSSVGSFDLFVCYVFVTIYHICPDSTLVF